MVGAPSSILLGFSAVSATLLIAVAVDTETYWSPPVIPDGAPPGPNATYALSDGAHIPIVGFGVHQSPPGQETYDAVRWALEAGYRLVDTAAVYGNEADVGRAVRDSGVPREDVFVATKLSGDDHGFEGTLRAFEESRRRLGVNYVDLYLVHSPFGGRIVETWDAVLHLKERGLVRSVGVSNFDVRHIEAIEGHGRPLPVVNQIEMHPLIYRERRPLMRWCEEKGILTQAYGSMLYGQTDRMGEEPLPSIAREAGRTVAQVLLRWGLQHRIQVIPKSVNRDRIRENLDLFDFQLSEEYMSELDAWSGRQLGMYWNPLEAEVDVGDTSHWSPPSVGDGITGERAGEEQAEL